MASIESVMIRASAGSGKTWQLANRYIALLALGVKPEKIIALTFTKKAAGEFHDRILTRLAEGAKDDAHAADLAEALKSTIIGDDSMPALVDGKVELPDMNVDFFRVKLKQVVEEMGRLALSTLDSFFVKLLRNFAFEMGMSGFELLEGNDLEVEKMKVFADLFSVSFSSGTEVTEKGMQQFVQAFRQTSMQDEGINVHGKLGDFVDKYQQRWLKNPDERSWGNEATMWPKGLPKGGGGYAKKARRVLGLLEAEVLDNKRYTKALKTVAEVLQDRDGKVGTPIAVKGRLPMLLSGLQDLNDGEFHDVYYKKEVIVCGDLAEALYDLLSTLVVDEIRSKLERTQGVYEVISAYEERYNKRVRGQGKLGFSDATLLLSGHESTGLWDSASKELVEFRFDGKFDHWMLDEFQDTSKSQWEVIRNLIDEVVNHVEGDRSLFVVGDTKQGIYGWRGGEPKLFDDLAERYTERLSEYPMDKSYRSAESVLALVNEVCNPASKGMQSFPPDAVKRWKFQEHEAARADLTGHSWVCEMDEVEDESMEDMRQRWVGGLVKKLDPVRRGLSCAILVRKNDHASELANYLRDEHPDVPVAVENELLVGEENPVSAVLVDAFRFLCYPQDSLAWWHVQMSPFGEIFGGDQDAGNMRSVWYRWTREISQRGIDTVLAEWCDALSQQADLSKYSTGRLAELRQAAAGFIAKGGGLKDWLNEVVVWKQREVTRKGVVQIMTVHKAKGLGFDTVILPYLDNSAFDSEGRMSVLDSETRDGVNHVMMAPVKDVRNADAVLKQEIEKWAVEQCYEQFCVLYVMLTRSVHATYCLLDSKKDKPDDRKRNEADWIRSSVDGNAERDESLGELAGRVIYEHGSWEWLDEKPLKNVSDDAKEESPKLNPVESRQKEVIAGDNKPKQFAKMMMDRGGLEYGNLVHQCFESIEWWTGDLEWSQDKRVRGLVLECMQSPSVLPFFEARSGLKVYREQAIESMLDGAWVSGVIDRLVVECDAEGKVLNAAIIDFKTDKVEDADELAVRYADQLDRYRKMIRQTYSLSEENVYALILSTHFKKTINL